MATEEVLKPHTFEAAGDLSANQYRFVKLNSSQRIELAGAGENAIGILQDKPAAAGRAGCVAIGGRSKVRFGGTVASADPVAVGANGLAVLATSGELSMGICVQGGASGEIGSMIFDKQALVG